MERRAGWVLAVTGALAVLAGPVAGVWGDHLGRTLVNLPVTALYYGTGLVAFLRRPDHRIAVRMLAFGTALAAGFAVGSLLSAELAVAGPPAWAWAGALLVDALNWLALLAPLSLFAVFPDGEYHRSYERKAVLACAWLLPAVLVLRAVGSARPTSTQFMWEHDIAGENPLAVPPLAGLGRVGDVLALAPLTMLVLGVVLLVLRYRRFTGEPRRQTAWPLAALVLTVVCFVVLGAFSRDVNSMPTWVGYLLFAPVLALLPASLLLGMFRHRLLDIDLVVRRSVVYGVFWTLIAMAYVAVAAELGMLAGRRLPLGLAILLTILATLVAAPARRRLEQLADRVVFGRRQSGYQVIAELGARLQASPAAEDVAATVATSLRDALGLRWVRVVVDGTLSRPVASAGAGNDDPAAFSVPLVHGGDVVGRIECGPKREGRLSGTDRELVEALGRQTALAIRNSQLAAELSVRLHELEASRTRLVHAEAQARQRLERDIHDGVQQELVAVLTRLAMARNRLRRGEPVGDRTLEEVQHDTGRALENLQELARGIHPPVLSDRGLLEAVEERAVRCPVRVAVTSNGLARGERLAADVEGAAYFVVSEALTNVLKHSGAAHAEVRVRRAAGVLEIDVRDDGRGFAVEVTGLRGLSGLRDRVEALGGGLRVTSSPGHGCSVRVTLPVNRTEVPSSMAAAPPAKEEIRA